MKSAIFKIFILSLMMVANIHLAYAQSSQQGIIPNGKATFLDNNGNPVSSGTVDFYIPGTSTRKTTYSDINGTVPNTNPVVLDAAGRALLWGNGSYRQVVKDKFGNQIWDTTTIVSGGSGGGSVATGDGDLVGTIKPWAGTTAPNQYMFTYGQEVSRTTYSALFTAITSNQGVFCNSGSPTLTGVGDTTNFWVGMKVEVSCVPSGVSTVVSKTSGTVTLAVNANTSINTTALFFMWGNGDGTTTFNLPDFRGVVPMGNNTMGGVASTNMDVTNFGATGPNSIGALGGNKSQSITLSTSNLPPYTPAGFVSTSVTTTVNDLRMADGSSPLTSSISMGSSSQGSAGSTNTPITSAALSVFTGVGQGGASSPITFSRVQPSKTVNYIIKVTPDSSSSSAGGVTALGGMTGDVACGNGLSCTGNVIANAGVLSVGGMTGNLTCGSGLNCVSGVISAPTSGGLNVFNPLTYGAIGDGITDDTTAWNNMCSAVVAAGSGWIWSPPGKTYRVFTNYSAANQVLCRLNPINALRVTMNGSQIISHYIAQVVMGGTGTTGDTINWTFSSWVGHAGFPVTVIVPMGTGYTPSQMATVMANAINGNATLTAANITATAVGPNVNINDIGVQIGWYTGNSNGSPGLVVTGAKTETMTINPLYGFLLGNASNIIFDDLTANGYSGYADSTRNSTGQLSWIYCTASGAAAPAYGCRNAQFNNLSLSGCSNSVAIARFPHTGDWSRNISVNGYVENCGYGTSMQSDGQQVTSNLTTFNVGRALIGYNTSGIRAWLNDSRTRDLALNAIDVGAAAYIGDISNSTTSDVFINYKFSLSGSAQVAPTTYLAITHTQGETGTSNLPSHVDNIHFNVDITVPPTTAPGLISALSFIGNATSQTPGEVSGSTEIGNSISGVWNGAAGGPSFGCIMSNTGSCSGYGSNLTRGSWSIGPFFAPSDTRPWNLGGNLNNVLFYNTQMLGATQPVVDGASPSLNLVYQAPITFNSTIIGGPSCASSGTVTVIRGAISSC